MGNKIITEKDFWMCTTGAVPAQLQSTQLVSNKKTGEKYITVRDKTTSSFIDFGCTKYMLLMAIAAAILIVAAVVIGVITVATGGLGLVAIGALAGLAGGVLGAVVGSLLCGQKMATQRQWIMPKANFKILEASTITGDCTMICPIGGTVKFAPNIKSWTEAIGLASLNYVTKLAECAIGGAMVGAALAALGGLFTGTATLAMPTFASIGSNIAFTFTGFGGWMGAGRLLGGIDNVANEYAFGHVNNAGDAAQSVVFGAIPEAGIVHRIVTTGQVYPSDALLLLYFLNIKAKAPVATEVEPGTTHGEEGFERGKKENGNQDEQPADNGVPKSGTVEAGEGSGEGNFEAYEMKTDDVPENVKNAESDMRDRPVEHGQFFDKNGNPISDVIVGSEGKITGLDKYFGKVDDGIFTHNHPKGGLFSEADLQFAKDANLGEIRATSPDGTTFSAKRPVDGWKDPEPAFRETRNQMREDPKAWEYYNAGDTKSFNELYNEKLMNNLKEAGYTINKY